MKVLLVYESVMLIALLAFLRWRKWPLHRLGLWPSLREVPAGAGLAVAVYLAYLAGFLTTSWLWPALQQADIAGLPVAPGLSLALIVAVSVLNPVFEELFVCGYVVASLIQRRSLRVAVAVSVAIRISYHLYQGVFSVVCLIPLGLIFAYWYARTGRLWPVIVAHAIFDLIGLLLLSRW